MRLTAYRITKRALEMRPASVRRQWMDESANRFAYRCLPLTVANSYGWELLSGCTFEAVWTGGRARESTQIVGIDADPDAIVSNHFGEGILTFHPGFLFRTEEEYDLHVSGPANCCKDGVSPLTGIVETNWLPFTFTMNWIFTRVGVPIRFERGEPICQIFPIPKGLVERVEPEIQDISDDRALMERFHAWANSREHFNERLRERDSQEHAEGWQRFYNRGTTSTGDDISLGHRTKLSVKPFVDRTVVVPAELPPTAVLERDAAAKTPVEA
jgi:hypothetical protein